VANVINLLPKSAQPTAGECSPRPATPEDRAHAAQTIDAFASEFGAKWPKAVAKTVDNAEPLLAFYDLPAEHWIHLKTTTRDRVDLLDRAATAIAGRLNDEGVAISASQVWRILSEPGSQAVADRVVDELAGS
jgi:transposase-like protein